MTSCRTDCFETLDGIGGIKIYCRFVVGSRIATLKVIGFGGDQLQSATSG
ncbi:MAG: hypothetical protein R3D67_19170 [Hyphomicrobiaceae bacterium]